MAPSEEVILYTHQVSPYAQRVHLAMVAKGIPFKAEYVDFANKPAGLLKANPIYGKVPTLVHGKNSVCESLVILEYLDEAWPETTPLLPKDSLGKAKARFWADYIYKGSQNMQKLSTTKPNTPERDAVMVEIPKWFKTLEETMVGYSAEGPFFTGDKFTYLDVVLSPLACWGVMLDKLLQASTPGEDELPRLHKWIKAVKEHEAYKKVILPDEEIAEFFSQMLKKRAAAAAAAAAEAAEAK